MRYLLIFLLLSGCSMKTTITDPNGRMYTIKNGPNKNIEFKQGDTEIKVSGRWFHVKIGKDTD